MEGHSSVVSFHEFCTFPLREFKDLPNSRQSKLSLCNGDVRTLSDKIVQMEFWSTKSIPFRLLLTFWTFGTFTIQFWTSTSKCGNVCQKFDRLIPKPFFIENLSNNSTVHRCTYKVHLYTIHTLPTFYTLRYQIPTYLVLKVITCYYMYSICKNNSNT